MSDASDLVEQFFRDLPPINLSCPPDLLYGHILFALSDEPASWLGKNPDRDTDQNLVVFFYFKAKMEM